MFEYQDEGVAHLAKGGYPLLADEPGLGKSRQAVLACKELDVQQVRVVCPAIARVNWQREFFKWWPEGKYKLIVESYAALTMREKQPITDALILDEAHYLKNPDSLRTRAVYGDKGAIRYAGAAMALTGTPMPNHVGELWTYLRMNGLTDMTYTQFIDRYCDYHIHSRHGRLMFRGSKRNLLPEVGRMLEGHMLRRLRVDVANQLPALWFQLWPISVEIDDLPRAQDIPDDEVDTVVRTFATKRREWATAKAGVLAVQIAEELEDFAYDKIVIFTHHKEAAELLMLDLRNFGPVLINGDVSDENRNRALEKFNNDPSCRVCVASIQAAGIAISMTAAKEALFVELDPVPGNNVQAAMRVHRLGQTRDVRIRIASAANSIDESINSILSRKMTDCGMLYESSFGLETLGER